MVILFHNRKEEAVITLSENPVVIQLPFQIMNR